MKKIILSIVLCTIVSYGFSQTNVERRRVNEIGIDAFDLAFLRALDVTYEYVGNKDLGIGLTARYCFDSDSDLGEKYGFTPFLRYYFFNKKDYGAKGFYAESFLKLYGSKNIESYYGFSSDSVKNYFDMAFGVGLGFKYVSHSGFVLDLNIGGGRSFGISTSSPVEFTGRGCILFGYRF